MASTAAAVPPTATAPTPTQNQGLLYQGRPSSAAAGHSGLRRRPGRRAGGRSRPGPPAAAAPRPRPRSSTPPHRRRTRWAPRRRARWREALLAALLADEVHRVEGLVPRAPVEELRLGAQGQVLNPRRHHHAAGPPSGRRWGPPSRVTGRTRRLLDVLLDARVEGANLRRRRARQLEVGPRLEELLVGLPGPGLVPQVEGGEAQQAVELHQLVVREVRRVEAGLQGPDGLLEVALLDLLLGVADLRARRAELEEGKRGKGRTSLGRAAPKRPPARTPAMTRVRQPCIRTKRYQSGVEKSPRRRCRSPRGHFLAGCGRGALTFEGGLSMLRALLPGSLVDGRKD